MLSETAPIPGSEKILALATGHHTYSTGCIVRIDPTDLCDQAVPDPNIREIPGRAGAVDNFSLPDHKIKPLRDGEGVCRQNDGQCQQLSVFGDE